MQLFTLWLGISIFIVGLIVGSFLNCLIYRMKTGRGLGGRSFCVKCKHLLSWQDLVPLLSYCELEGRCRYCKKTISIQYPLVEAACGLLFAAAAFTLTPSVVYDFDFSLYEILTLLYYFFVIASLIVIFVYDLRWYAIPDAVVASLLAASSFYYFAQFLYVMVRTGSVNVDVVANPLLAAVLAGSFFLAVFLVSRGRWMGFGDVKFSVAMGLILGFPQILTGLFFAFFIGAIIGTGLIFFNLKKISSEIPFGPFLATGTAIALFFGPAFVNWYLSATF